MDYARRATEAAAWARLHGVKPAETDAARVGLLLIDVQNTFCVPGFELFVGGRSGRGAVEDSVRLCEFLYRNLGRITQVVASLDTHTAMQIFHPSFLVDASGEHPAAMTAVSLADVESGKWRANPAIAAGLGHSPDSLQKHLLHYCRRLAERGKFALMIWPWHAMIGGIGHALVPAVEEALFFHSLARQSPAHIELKGMNPLTENYSVLRPEVLDGPDNRRVAEKNEAFIRRLLDFDALVIAGQAKSHCVAWTIEDLLSEITARDAALARRIYLLEDCTSAVVVPGIVDFTEAADEAYGRFVKAGMHTVRSTDPIERWPDFPSA